MYKKLSHRDSNPGHQRDRLACYHCTIGDVNVKRIKNIYIVDFFDFMKEPQIKFKNASISDEMVCLTINKKEEVKDDKAPSLLVYAKKFFTAIYTYLKNFIKYVF